MLIGDLVIYIGTSVISFGSSGVVVGTLRDQVEVLFSSKVLHAVSILGNSTKKRSCLVNTMDLVNISRLRGEERSKHEIHNNKNTQHHNHQYSQRAKREPP